MNQSGPQCPICGKPVVAEFRPFCSVRCKQIDLNRWLSESYRVPARPLTEDDEAQSVGEKPEEDD